MSVCLMVLASIKTAFEYDTFHPYRERTYRIITQVTGSEDQVQRSAVAPLPLANALQQTAFVENTTRVYPAIRSEASDGQKKLNIAGAFADPSFFDVFGFRLESGNPDVALSEPQTLVLTRETADKFFGSQNPLGKILKLDNLGDFTVTGILEATRQKTHLQFDVLASMSSVPALEKQGQLNTSLLDWSEYAGAFTYVLLKPGSEKETLDTWLPLLTSQIIKPYPFKNGEKNIRFEAQKLGNITPGEVLFHESTSKPTTQSLLIISAIACMVLLSACFNYTNLSIARSLSRAREVGIRKVVGAFRHQIFVQFITESVVITCLALLLAYLLLPFLGTINRFEEAVSGIHTNYSLIAWFIGFGVLVGILAGALPAWVLSAYKPVQTLKNLSGLKVFKHLTLRKGLVVFQFSLSLVFIIILLAYYQQTHYMVTADYGYNRQRMITIPLQGNSYQVATSELGRSSTVERIAATSGNFGYHPHSCEIRKQKKEQPVKISYYAVDQNFIPNTQVQLIAGSNFPEKLSSTHEQLVILNEKAVQVLKLGPPHEAIGQTLWLNDSMAVQVAGILKDFHFQNFKRAITPLALRYKPDEFTELQVKIHALDPQLAIASFEKIWKRIDPVHTFEYTLFDKAFTEHQQHADDLWQISFFALMALTIACLGLLGMVMYTAQTRIKEVGIRKVMGADIWTIVRLLSKDYLKLLVIAAVIALPVGYWAGSELLNEFAYRISLGAGTLLGGFAIILVLGLITIGSQTLKAANTNPVNSLRNE